MKKIQVPSEKEIMIIDQMTYTCRVRSIRFVRQISRYENRFSTKSLFHQDLSVDSLYNSILFFFYILYFMSCFILYEGVYIHTRLFHLKSMGLMEVESIYN